MMTQAQWANARGARIVGQTILAVSQLPGAADYLQHRHPQVFTKAWSAVAPTHPLAPTTPPLGASVTESVANALLSLTALSGTTSGLDMRPVEMPGADFDHIFNGVVDSMVNALTTTVVRAFKAENVGPWTKVFPAVGAIHEEMVYQLLETSDLPLYVAGIVSAGGRGILCSELKGWLHNVLATVQKDCRQGLAASIMRVCALISEEEAELSTAQFTQALTWAVFALSSAKKGVVVAELLLPASYAEYQEVVDCLKEAMTSVVLIVRRVHDHIKTNQ